jgi:small subunit ribosomal protein S1
MQEIFYIGQEYEAKVVTIERDERKMSLSIKQLTRRSLEHCCCKYQVGTKHTGDVKNLTPYGVFVELENGIGGMVHISDLSHGLRDILTHLNLLK